MRPTASGMGSGQQAERLDVAWTHDREVAAVEGRHLLLAQLLAGDDDGRVDQPEIERGVGPLELGGAREARLVARSRRCSPPEVSSIRLKARSKGSEPRRSGPVPVEALRATIVLVSVRFPS